MAQSRRLFLQAAALTLPAMACTAVASAAERQDNDPLSSDATLSVILKRDARASCPLCSAGKPCAEHLI